MKADVAAYANTLPEEKRTYSAALQTLFESVQKMQAEHDKLAKKLKQLEAEYFEREN